jgi:hypothetical protein
MRIIIIGATGTIGREVRAGTVRTARGHRGGPEGWEEPGGLDALVEFAQEPMPGTSAISPVNGALESFTRAAALELPRGIRINVVSPP